MKPISTIDDKELLAVLMDIKAETAKLFGKKLKQLVLFGSYTRDAADTESDIDIMILVEDTEESLREYKYVVVDIMGELSLKHDRLISLTEVPYHRYTRYLKVLPFYKNVNDEGIEIYGRDTA
jgi:uncharacterized protein